MTILFNPLNLTIFNLLFHKITWYCHKFTCKFFFLFYWFIIVFLIINTFKFFAFFFLSLLFFIFYFFVKSNIVFLFIIIIFLVRIRNSFFTSWLTLFILLSLPLFIIFNKRLNTLTFELLIITQCYLVLLFILYKLFHHKFSLRYKRFLVIKNWKIFLINSRLFLQRRIRWYITFGC